MTGEQGEAAGWTVVAGVVPERRAIGVSSWLGSRGYLWPGGEEDGEAGRGTSCCPHGCGRAAAAEAGIEGNWRRNGDGDGGGGQR